MKRQPKTARVADEIEDGSGPSRYALPRLLTREEAQAMARQAMPAQMAAVLANNLATVRSAAK